MFTQIPDEPNLRLLAPYSELQRRRVRDWDQSSIVAAAFLIIIDSLLVSRADTHSIP